MVLPVGLSYHPLVPRKMTCMLILLRAGAPPLGQLLPDFFGKRAFYLREDLEGFVCESCGFCSPVELVQSEAFAKEGLAFSLAIFHLFEYLQRLVAMIDRLVDLAKIKIGFAQNA